MPTLREKVNMYEGLLHDLQLYFEVSMDSSKVKLLLNNISNWSYAHRTGNGMLTDRKRTTMINVLFHKLRKVN